MSKKNGMVFSLEMKKNGGYFLDVLSNTLHITPLFEKKAAVYGTKECEIMDTLLLRNAVKPTIQVHENKRAPRITYLMMEVFISKMPNAEANFREYKSVCLKSKVAKNPYKEVLSWFEKAFPFYHNLKAEVDGKVVWNALDEYRKALESQSGNANNIITLSAATEDKKDAVASA